MRHWLALEVVQRVVAGGLNADETNPTQPVDIERVDIETIATTAARIGGVITSGRIHASKTLSVVGGHREVGLAGDWRIHAEWEPMPVTFEQRHLYNRWLHEPLRRISTTEEDVLKDREIHAWTEFDDIVCELQCDTTANALAESRERHHLRLR